MTQFQSHLWVTVVVLFVALWTWIGNKPLPSAPIQTEESAKLLDIERYPDEPLQIVNLRIGTHSVKDKIRQRFKDNKSKWAIDRVKFNEKDDWYKRVSITLRNTSDKPIYGVESYLFFKPSGFPMVFSLALTGSKELLDNPLQPGNEIELSVNQGLLNLTLADLKNHGVDVDQTELSFSLDSVIFNEELRWYRGKLLHPDTVVPNKWVPIDQPVAMKANKSPAMAASFETASLKTVAPVTPAVPSKHTVSFLATCKEYLDSYQGVTCNGDSSVDCITKTDLDTSINPGLKSQVLVSGLCIMNNFSGQNCQTSTTHTRFQTDPNCQPCPDADGDGYAAKTCGGTDCDDTDRDINPGADEICNDGKDNDCDGIHPEILSCDWGECPDTCRGDVDFCTYPLTGCADDQFRNANCCYKPSPIVIDVNGNGFDLTSGAGGVYFDLNSDGTAEKMSWTSQGADDAWLTLDRNGNGSIDNGQELFGSFTSQPLPPPGKSRNGFNALAEFDKPVNGGNSDGQISNQDSVFSKLKLWQDLNHNGISEAGELRSLEQHGLKTLALDYKESNRTDQHGNWFRYRAKIEDVRGVQAGRWAWDVFVLPGTSQSAPNLMSVPNWQALIKDNAPKQSFLN